MSRNEQLERVGEALVGRWSISITNQWWLEDPTTVTSGTAVGEWLDDSFVRLRAELDGELAWDFVFGRNDAEDRTVALYFDPRGTMRVFDVHLDGSSWSMSRTDSDFHQRFVLAIDGDRMEGPVEASEDEGATWRKDFDLTFERVRSEG